VFEDHSLALSAGRLLDIYLAFQPEEILQELDRGQNVARAVNGRKWSLQYQNPIGTGHPEQLYKKE